MKVTKEKLIHINNNLFEVSEIKGVKFAYAVSKNKKLIADEMDALSEMQKPSEDFIQYEKTLFELAKKHAKRTKEGEPVTQIAPNGSVGFVVDEDNLIFKEAKKRLDEKFEAAIEDRKAVSQEIESILKEEIELDSFNFHKIHFENLPEELNAKQLELLEFMIVE